MSANDKRLEELLADAAVGPLAKADQRELAALLGERGGDDTYDRAAAATHLAHGGKGAALPEALARKIAADGARVVAQAARPAAKGGTTTAAGAQVVVMTLPERARPDLARWAGWLAAAACLAALAGQAWRTEAARGGSATAATVQDMHATITSAAARAELSWHAETQRGALRVSGLAPTDAASEYEVWLTRAGASGDEPPVPAARFAVVSSGQAIDVPLAPTVRVDRLGGLFITRERAGGVVVTTRAAVVLSGSIDAR